ncbi:gluconolactonase [Paenibacillus thailandensis]|uniref:Gluconolactonase n=1 Tax=Paenibacillus thailandensis TaxID=393250 RepID=A0ABW5QT79_9BACL
MQRVWKRWAFAVAAASLLFGSASPAASAAAAPYESYNYNYWGEAVPSPAPYLPARAVTGDSLGVGGFKEPGDVYVSPNGRIYILDSGNNRIIVLDRDWSVKQVIAGFASEGAEDGFSGPSGLFVDDNERIYVADTGNRRVVILDGSGKLEGVISNPKSDLFSADFQFAPLKVAVDKANRVYVVAQGVFEGIMQFDDKGRFIGYVGTNKVRRDYTEYIWRLLSTKAQRAQMVLFIPTEFSNLDIDPKGFLYATNIDPGSREPVKRINPSGEDVLKRFGYFDVRGDIRFRNSVGPSKMVDVKLLGSGMYGVLDSTQNRIFTYDDEGNLLYVYGGKGNQLGTFKTPVAIEQAGSAMLVLDRGKESITVFEPTRFGSAVNQAVKLHYDGEDSKAVPYWKEVLKLNSNYDIAYLGIGKSLLMEKKNKEALEYFKLGMDRKDYSVAYKRYRREAMKEHFGAFLTALLAAALAFAAFKAFKARNRRRGNRHEAGLY